MSFTEMMQQAISIRTSTDANLRVDFDARPKFQQASMFANQEVLAARDLPLEKRVGECTSLKLEGNEEMRNGCPDKACQLYEQALAMFWYLKNHNINWKTSGIKDEDIEEVNFCLGRGSEKSTEEIRDLNVALLLNIARAYSAQNDHTTSARACSAALTLNPCSAKALYLRGKALVSPASAGAFETDAAIRDVSRAAKLAPSDCLIKAFMAKLKTEKANQKETDRATFAGMFGRGNICDPGGEAEASRLHAPTHGNVSAGGDALRGKPDRAAGKHDLSMEYGQADAGNATRSAGAGEPLETRRHVEERVEYFKDMARKCDEEGLEEEAEQYRERFAAIEKLLSEHDRQQQERAAGHERAHVEMDWRNPSKAMLKRAREEEYDLSNPAVVSFLVKMQEMHRRKLTTQQGPDDDDDQENWSLDVWEGAILCMSRAEVTSFLTDELGIDPRPPDTPLGTLRLLAASRVLGRPSLGQGTSSPGRQKPAGNEKGSKRTRADWRISATVTLLLFLSKAYQMGLFKWLMAGDGGGVATQGTRESSPPAASSRDLFGEGAGGIGRGAGRDMRSGPLPSLIDGEGAEVGIAAVAVAAEDFGDNLAAKTLASATRTTSWTSTEDQYSGGCDVTGGTCRAE
ncbi:unnamed protein product [Ectocarpus sp. 12 AP-2014]